VRKATSLSILAIMGVHRHNFALAVVSGLPVVAAITVGLRFLARWRRRVPYAWGEFCIKLIVIYLGLLVTNYELLADDWFLAIATVIPSYPLALEAYHRRKLTDLRK
jgi:hypothetical protein